MFVFDATPLIYLASTERLHLLDGHPEACVVPEPVYEEVVTTGIEEGHPDARRLQRAIDEDVFEVVAVTPVNDAFDRIRDNERFSDADAAVLAVADERDATAVMDERYGRAVADAEGIETRGTAYLVLERLRDGEIDAEEARETIDAMLDAGWYCSPDVYARILEAIDEHGDPLAN